MIVFGIRFTAAHGQYATVGANAPSKYFFYALAEDTMIAAIREKWIPEASRGIYFCSAFENHLFGRVTCQGNSVTQNQIDKSRIMNVTTVNQSMMNPNKALWEKGDFTRLAQTMRKSGEELVSKLGITPGLEILDLGCGDGTTAIPAARLGANVLGVDIARNLVFAGNIRAQEEGLSNCTFQEGDAADLSGLEDHSFDLLVTIFGAMFASRPYDVAREMVRVTRQGGRIVMGNWIPGDPTLVAQILKISSAHTPPPPEGFISPMLWGVEEHVIDRFTKAGIPAVNVSFQKETFTFEAPYAPTEFVQKFKNFYGPTMNAFEAAEKNGKAAELQGELEALFVAQNQSSHPDHTSIPATYLKVTVLR